jgi:hypothetical protein
MKRSTLAALASLLGAISIGLPAQAGACRFNGTPRDCEPNQGHRTPLTKGSNLDIHWADGEITTIRFLGPRDRPTQKGDPVLINGKTRGIVTFNRDVQRGVFELGFRSSTGNTFSVQLGD